MYIALLAIQAEVKSGVFINGSGFQLRRAAALEYVCPLRFKAPPSNPHPALQLALISQI